MPDMTDFARAGKEVKWVLGNRGYDVVWKIPTKTTSGRCRIEIPEKGETFSMRIRYNPKNWWSWCALVHEFYHAVTFVEWPAEALVASDERCEIVCLFWEQLSRDPEMLTMNHAHVSSLSEPGLKIFTQAIQDWEDWVDVWWIAHKILTGGV